MKVHWIALMLVIGAALFAPAVSAKLVEEKDGYRVTSDAGNLRLPDVSALSSLSVSQGQTVSYSTFVPSGKTAFISNLYWGVTSNSLSLTVNAPDSTPGPYYDAADGQVDGRINLRFSKSGGIASGPRKSCIYGYAVNGAQKYMNTTTST
nr:peptidase domain-containing protein [uncultured Methanoregula sp.]